MLKELMSIFGAGDPLREIADEFSMMLSMATENSLTAGKVCFGELASGDVITDIFKVDVRINKQERSIRNLVLTHVVSGGQPASLPYALVIMSLVKDVERIGDYAKNLCEIPDLQAPPYPEGPLLEALARIREQTDTILTQVGDTLETQSTRRAHELILLGKDAARASDVLLNQIAAAGLDSRTTTAMVLAVRYYKRLGGHLLNLLSSVVVPLAELDFFDERRRPSSADSDPDV